MARFRNSESFGRGWAPYVPVAERRRKAAKKVASLTKKGKRVSPVQIEGRTIARTFWGRAWCDNLEAYSDFSNRLPRGRTYVRNGSVIDLQISEGEITGLVSGSSLYTVKIKIHSIEGPRWNAIIQECSGKIDSIIELLQGNLSKGVMEVITSQKRGLFPAPRQIQMTCTCPDGAVMCKHVAAVLYGVGARLDDQPELIFMLRKVDHLDLISQAGAVSGIAEKSKINKKNVLESSDLSELFGIEIEKSKN